MILNVCVQLHSSWATLACVDEYEDREHALEHLRFHWGTAYAITWSGMFRAERRDGEGQLNAITPDGLMAAVLDDYHRKPVPRVLQAVDE